MRLDKKRLVKQRLEALDCLYVVLATNSTERKISLPADLHAYFPVSYTRTGPLVIKRWRNHACVRQWMENPYTLAHYLFQIAYECDHQKVADNAAVSRCASKLLADLNFRAERELNRTHWWTNTYFIHQHRAALLQKDFAHYSEFYPFITPAPTSDYFWWDPVQERFYRIVKAARKIPHHYVYYDFLPVGDSSA